MDLETADLDRALLAFIGEGADRPRDDERFNALALRLFTYQFRRNPVYRNFCVGRGLTPETVAHWSQIPAIPTMAFKEMPIACFPIERAVAAYESSGTTGTKRSRHYLDTLTLYDASLLANFKASVLPDVASMRMLVLAAPSRALPHSSLSHMLEVVVERLGMLGSGFYLDEGGLRTAPLVAALGEAEGDGVPVCLLGTAFAFVHFLDHCAAKGMRFRLPMGSRIMDTGGFKGRSREVPKSELYALYEQVFGVPQDRVVNEYGMSELGSQFYDDCLRTGAVAPRKKMAPPWARTLVVAPETLQSVTEGRTGLLRHYDLANRGSVMAVQTDDLGVGIGDGFEGLGRAEGAEARGCSIAADELLSRGR